MPPSGSIGLCDPTRTPPIPEDCNPPVLPATGIDWYGLAFFGALSVIVGAVIWLFSKKAWREDGLRD